MSQEPRRSEDAPPRAHYVTAPDRIGLAVLAGGVLAAFVALPFVAAGGQRSAAVLGLAWGLGAVVAMLGIVAVFGPVWLVLHRRDRRGPGVAAMTAGLLVLGLLTAGQVVGTSGGGYRWASAIGTSLLVAVVAAGIGAAMQRVAYRRLL